MSKIFGSANVNFEISIRGPVTLIYATDGNISEFRRG